jgi:hypothetical protein
MKNRITRTDRRTALLNIKPGKVRFKRTPDYYVLWGFVVLLLIFNLALVWYLFAEHQQVVMALQEVETYRQKFETRLGQAGTMLANIKGGTLEYVASIDQTIPFSATIPLDYEVEVPVNMTIPINTSISVPIPGIQGASITVPISANIPVNTTIKVPINMSIPVDTSVPIKLDIPVSIKISDTFLAASLDEMQALLDQLSLDLGGFSLDFMKLP